MTRIGAPTSELLAWLVERPRTYRETIEAWKSSCPRLTAWEDALADGLVRIERGNVVVTSDADAASASTVASS